jgi:tartrate dehydratase alpha subunit/fumarate hydratase class I-like protein
MQFDHIRVDKDFNLGNAWAVGYSVEVIQREIAKTQVVCANCHAERTHQRRLNTSAKAEHISEG